MICAEDLANGHNSIESEAKVPTCAKRSGFRFNLLCVVKWAANALEKFGQHGLRLLDRRFAAERVGRDRFERDDILDTADKTCGMIVDDGLLPFGLPAVGQ